MKSLGAIVGSVALAIGAILPLSAAVAEHEHPMLQLSSDSHFHYQLLLPFGEAIYSGADVGSILGAAKDIIPGDMASFSSVFHRLANETKAAALNPFNAHDPINVRDTWFSAATYFRRADFYLHGDWDNPLIDELWVEQITAFDNAMATLPIPGRRLQVATDDFTIEAIWYATSTRNRTRRPTLILGNGYDGSQEDLYHTVVAPALARGWNCLTYEGPGHPSVRRNQGLGFIPEWERVITPLVDYLLTERADVVDPDRLALFGYSFGGSLAARAAAFEPRIKALLLNGGVWDAYDAWVTKLSPALLELLEAGNKEQFDKITLEMRDDPEVPASIRWGINQGLWSFKTKSPYDYFQMAKLHTLKGISDGIKTPTWIADGELEDIFAGHGQLVQDALGDIATLHMFKGVAGHHCQAGALQEMNRVMFGWLKQTLG
ncbi:hypothetical protein ACLOAV_003769 [Pseudogymnoascus australis]